MNAIMLCIEVPTFLIGLLSTDKTVEITGTVILVVCFIAIFYVISKPIGWKGLTKSVEIKL